MSKTNILALFLVALLASCSLPFGKKTDQTPPPVKTDKGEAVTPTDQPKPGDVRLVNGIEYIYARNRRYQLTPYEPEYEWVRKDDYSEGLFDTVSDKLTGSSAAKKERAEMEQRMAKLEQNIKQRDATATQAPQRPVGKSSVFLSGKTRRTRLHIPFSQNEEACPHPPSR